jgi:hypothetical protein
VQNGFRPSSFLFERLSSWEANECIKLTRQSVVQSDSLLSSNALHRFARAAYAAVGRTQPRAGGDLRKRECLLFSLLFFCFVG